MKKFITPVAMKVTKEQYESDLQSSLEGLGYEHINCDGTHLCTFADGKNNKVARIPSRCKTDMSRYLIEDYNPKLFLALAAMTEGDEYGVGEWGICKANTNSGHAYIHNKFYQCKEVSVGLLYTVMDDTGSNSNAWGIGNFKKATKEELINHFSGAKEEQDAKHISEDKVTFDNAEVGDTFINSIGNKTTIVKKSFNSIKVKTPDTEYNISLLWFDKRIKNKEYTQYTRINSKPKANPFDNAKEVYHCETEEIANELLILADSFGYGWCDGKSFTDNSKYGTYGKETCYRISKGEYSRKQYFLDKGYVIINAEEFLNQLNSKSIKSSSYGNNNNKNEDSKTVNEPINRRLSEGKSDISFGRCGDGFEASSRDRKKTIINFGTGKRPNGEGIHPRRRSSRTVKI